MLVTCRDLAAAHGGTRGSSRERVAGNIDGQLIGTGANRARRAEQREILAPATIAHDDKIPAAVLPGQQGRQLNELR